MKIAIIGAGITGLRAALELAPTHEVTLFEKSSGVGGRVATRRFGDVHVNHGASSFERISSISHDPVAHMFENHFKFDGAATALPKAMRDIFLDFNGKLRLNTHIKRLEGYELILNDDTRETFDRFIFTAPLPQIREILQAELFPEVSYTKELLFIGLRNERPVIEKVTENLVEELFELPEEMIRVKCGLNTEGLTLKKWRYARVRKGVRHLYHMISDKQVIAGDVFDPEEKHDIASAWNSGRYAGSMLV